jgi:peptidoglycan hydrolase-like protein with peptidoglycan-binding domain
LERSDLNWRGVAIFGLAVLTVIVLISVIDDEPAQLGVNTGGTAQDSGGGVTTTTRVPGAATTTTPEPTATTALDPAGRATLQTGSSGPDVTLVQQRLTDLGYYSGPVDGSYGAGTATAVQAFQTAEGITPADGVVGPATWTALATAT